MYSTSDWSLVSRDPARGAAAAAISQFSLQSSGKLSQCLTDKILAKSENLPRFAIINMDFQPPYFPPPFSNSAAAVTGHNAEVFSSHLQSDHYQHYAVSRHINYWPLI